MEIEVTLWIIDTQGKEQKWPEVVPANRPGRMITETTKKAQTSWKGHTPGISRIVGVTSMRNI
jgi:hypothetical protein